jgi:hypothetical protein
MEESPNGNQGDCEERERGVLARAKATHELGAVIIFDFLLT